VQQLLQPAGADFEAILLFINRFSPDRYDSGEVLLHPKKEPEDFCETS
jgi:hypothetical protein